MTELDPGTYTATLDRFEEVPGGELAVFVVEHGGDAVGQVDLPRETVPIAGRKPDAVFTLTIDEERFELQYRSEESAVRKEHARSRFDRLARRPPTREE